MSAKTETVETFNDWLIIRRDFHRKPNRIDVCGIMAGNRVYAYVGILLEVFTCELSDGVRCVASRV